MASVSLDQLDSEIWFNGEFVPGKMPMATPMR